jgi:predicted nucleic acid-binding protein
MIKLADAVIASTALLNNLIPATRNVDDFKGVKQLQIINPFAEEDRDEVY